MSKGRQQRRWEDNIKLTAVPDWKRVVSDRKKMRN